MEFPLQGAVPARGSGATPKRRLPFSSQNIRALLLASLTLQEAVINRKQCLCVL